MQIHWEITKAKYYYCHGKTSTRFSVQISESIEKGKYAWMIFHDDFRYCVHGDTANIAEEAKIAAENWLKENMK